MSTSTHGDLARITNLDIETDGGLMIVQDVFARADDFGVMRRTLSICLR
jgi:hypothetical protein